MSESITGMVGGAEGVPLLTRREIEARIVAPLVEAFSEEFGGDRVVEIVAGVVERLAREQGEQMAAAFGGSTLELFGKTIPFWSQGGALEIEMLEQSSEVLSFNVTRCKYAEMYRDLGLPQLGLILSCRRDFALVQGFDPHIELKRNQTIMEGAPLCDFRFSRRR